MSTNGREITIDDLSGQPCPRIGCTGNLTVYTSRQTSDGRNMQRFYSCNLCGCRPEKNKRVVPIEKSGARR